MIFLFKYIKQKKIMKNNLKLMDEIKIKNLFFKIVKKKKKG